MANNQQTFNPNATFNWDTEAGAPQIDTKNLGITQDQMHHEALAYKKCCMFTEWFTEQPLKDLSNRAAQHHKQHFDALMNYLNSHQ